MTESDNKFLTSLRIAPPKPEELLDRATWAPRPCDADEDQAFIDALEMEAIINVRERIQLLTENYNSALGQLREITSERDRYRKQVEVQQYVGWGVLWVGFMVGISAAILRWARP